MFVTNKVCGKVDDNVVLPCLIWVSLATDGVESVSFLFDLQDSQFPHLQGPISERNQNRKLHLALIFNLDNSLPLSSYTSVRPVLTYQHCGCLGVNCIDHHCFAKGTVLGPEFLARMFPAFCCQAPFTSRNACLHSQVKNFSLRPLSLYPVAASPTRIKHLSCG